MNKDKKMITLEIDGETVTWKKKDEEALKNDFNLNMGDEVRKLLKDKKKNHKEPQILENVPEEFRKGNKKILLEGENTC